jgi:hypothetical protein
MTVYADNVPVALYERFENQSYEVKGAKLYSMEDELIASFVPAISTSGYVVHIKDSQGARGLVSLVPKMSGFMQIDYDNTVDFFGKEYGLEISLKSSFTSAKYQYIVQRAQTPVLIHTITLSVKDGRAVETLVDAEYLAKEPMDTAYWQMAILLLNEISSYESSKNPPPKAHDSDFGPNHNNTSTNNGRNNTPTYNNNGTPDYNNNPFDNF